MNILKERHLVVKHSVSRGRDTYGYQIVALWDGNKRFATCGGGYDMLGAVFGDWLSANYMDRLKELVPYDEDLSMRMFQEKGYQPHQENYGLFCRQGHWCVDGACGLSTMLGLAEKIGLSVKQLSDRRGYCTIGFIVSDNVCEQNKNKEEILCV